MSNPRHLKGFTLIELLIVIAIIAILALIAIPNFIEAQTRSKVARVKADMRSVATAIEAYFVDNNSYPVAINVSPISPSHYKFFMTEKRDDYNGRKVDQTLGFILTTPIAYMTSIPLDPFALQSLYNEDLDVLTNFKDHDHGFFYVNFLAAGMASAKGILDASSVTARPAAEVPVPMPTRFAPDGPEHFVRWMMISAGPRRMLHLADDSEAANRWAYFVNLLNNKDHTDEVMEGTMFRQYDPTNGTTSRGGIFRSDNDVINNGC